MYHISNLGRFGDLVRPVADIDGYVPEQGDTPDDLRYDAAVEWDDGSWDAHVDRAVELTAQANAAAAEWQRGK